MTTHSLSMPRTSSTTSQLYGITTALVASCNKRRENAHGLYSLKYDGENYIHSSIARPSKARNGHEPRGFNVDMVTRKVVLEICRYALHRKRYELSSSNHPSGVRGPQRATGGRRVGSTSQSITSESVTSPVSNTYVLGSIKILYSSRLTRSSVSEMKQFDISAWNDVQTRSRKVHTDYISRINLTRVVEKDQIVQTEVWQNLVSITVVEPFGNKTKPTGG